MNNMAGWYLEKEKIEIIDIFGIRKRIQKGKEVKHMLIMEQLRDIEKFSDLEQRVAD